MVRYQITFDESAQNASVRVCFDGESPESLRRVGEGAPSLIRHPRSDRGALPVDETSLSLVSVAAGECIRYEVELAAANPREAMFRSGGEAIVTLGLILWAPNDDTPMIANFEAPGRHVSLPWDGELVPASAKRFAGNVAITRRPPRRLEVGALMVEVAQLDGPLEIDESGMDRWLRSALEAVQPLGGAFPRESLHLVVVPAGAAESAIVFGLVRRGGGASVLLFPASNASEQELSRAWVFVHELSHLTMPRLTGDRWISEGYATYMQELLRMRAGLLSPEEGWRRIASKLEEERVGAGMPLAEESNAMHRTRSYSHVYWAGAALFLEIDVALHRQGSSLFEVIGRAPWNEGERWDGYRCLAAIDAMVGASIAMPLAERYAALNEIPDLSAVLSELGIRHVEGRVELDDEASMSAIRRAMEARPASAQVSGEASR